MAKSPLKTVTHYHPLPDLLFSPRAAFIWNQTRKSVAWMNPAARAAFALCLEDFSGSLSADLIRRFAQCVNKNEGGFVKVKIRRGPALECSVEILKLAGGEDGLIVAELAADEELDTLRQAPSLPRKIAKGPKKAPRKSLSSKQGQKKRAPAHALTEEELRAFKAIGRTVLRLCEEKRRTETPDDAAPAPRAAPDGGDGPALPPVNAEQALKNVLAAFDLVLLLDGNLGIVSVEGRAPRLGWRKRMLKGTSVAGLLPLRDQAIFNRMVRKLGSPRLQSSRDTLVVRSGTGDGAPCRAVLSRWEDGGATFLLALLSLELPARLKKQQAAAAGTGTRLAA